MKIEPFAMERWQSLHENHVELNLSDSGVHPLTLREFLRPDEVEQVLDQRLVYTQTNGTPGLRERISALYAGATTDHVEVVNGGAEANFVCIWNLVESGDEVVLMTPNYGQIRGWVEALGGRVREWTLRPDFEGDRWVADLDQLASLVNERTRLIAICHPNNPTGARLEPAELDAIAALAERHDAWVLADEIYQGSDLDGGETATMFGRTEQVLITNSLSKAYGFPGLRLGWIVGPPERCQELWKHHDYSSIGPGAISDQVATLALEPVRRAALLQRTRELLGQNLEVVQGWVAEDDRLRTITPRAGAMLFLQYQAEVNSSELATRLKDEQSVLIVPGDHFGMDGWLRIGFGGETAEVCEGLARMRRLLEGRGAGA